MTKPGLHDTEVEQNLKDAGCRRADIERCMERLDRGEVREAVGILNGHRDELLERIHRDEKRIDCLDYLIYRLSSQDKTEVRK